MIAQALSLSLVLGFLFAFVGYLIWKAIDGGRTTIVFADADSPKMPIMRIRIRGDRFTVPKGPHKGTYLLNAYGQRSNKKGGAIIIHPRTGWVMLPPSTQDDDLERKLNLPADAPSMQELQVCNPDTYYKALKRNEIEDALGMNTDEKAGLEALAPWAFGALVVLVGMVGYLIYAWNKSNGAA